MTTTGQAIDQAAAAVESAMAAVRDENALMLKIIIRYLDNHCANADREGMSVLCECMLCRDARTLLRKP